MSLLAARQAEFTLAPWPMAAVLFAAVLLYYLVRQDQIKYDHNKSDLLHQMPRLQLMRAKLDESHRGVWGLLGWYGVAKLGYISIIGLIVFLVESDTKSRLFLALTYLWIAMVSSYQTVAVRLGLMPSEWSWISRQHRQYQRENVRKGSPQD